VGGHHEEAPDHPEGGGGGSIDPSQDRIRLSTSAIVHCLPGCGLGEVVGVVIGVAIGLTAVATIVLAVVLGFVFGFALGLIPLLRAGFSRSWAIHQVLVATGHFATGHGERTPMRESKNLVMTVNWIIQLHPASS